MTTIGAVPDGPDRITSTAKWPRHLTSLLLMPARWLEYKNVKDFTAVLNQPLPA